jgi:hypothetical protein
MKSGVSKLLDKRVPRKDMMFKRSHTRQNFPARRMEELEVLREERGRRGTDSRKTFEVRAQPLEHFAKSSRDSIRSSKVSNQSWKHFPKSSEVPDNRLEDLRRDSKDSVHSSNLSANNSRVSGRTSKVPAKVPNFRATSSEKT